MWFMETICDHWTWMTSHVLQRQLKQSVAEPCQGSCEGLVPTSRHLSISMITDTSMYFFDHWAITIHAKSGWYLWYITANFLDFPQNFRLRTRNQYCTQAITWGSTILDGGSTILDGGSTILDGSSTIFCWFSPFFVNFHHFLSIFTIYSLLSRFTFCRDLRTFSANFLWPK